MIKKVSEWSEFAGDTEGNLYHKGEKIRIYTNSKGFKYWKTPWGSIHSGRVHIMIARIFVPNPEKLPCVIHLDKNPANNRPENLRWCTKSELSLAHRVASSKLNKSHVREILASTEKGVVLAKRYNVSPSTITCVRKGQYWSHVETERVDYQPHKCKNKALTEDNVRQIRTLIAGGATRVSIAKTFGVYPGTIQNIANGTSWKWLDN